jgi:hypothetical protein
MSLDDIVVLMKPQSQVVVSGPANAANNLPARFVLPQEAIILRLPGANGQAGWLYPGADVIRNKTFAWGATEIFLDRDRGLGSKPGEMVYITDLQAAGFPVLEYDRISRSHLEERGFQVTQLPSGLASVELKMGLIPVGSGFLRSCLENSTFR